MSRFRIVRQFGRGMNTSTDKAYRVESSELLTEAEALALMRELGSPYMGQRYDDRVKARGERTE